MIEAHTAFGRSRVGRVKRYELSEALRSYLDVKYLRSPFGPAGPAAPAVNGSRVRPLANEPGRGRNSLGRAIAGRALVVVKLAALALTVIFFAILALQEAKADSVMIATSGMIQGSQADMYSFALPSAGTMTFTLADLDWPKPLTSLTLSVTTAAGLLGTMDEAGQNSFTFDGPGTYFVHVIGSADQGPGQLGIGVFGLLGDFSPATTPVPLPASVSLLLGGIAATMWSVHRSRKRRGWGAPLPAPEPIRLTT